MVNVSTGWASLSEAWNALERDTTKQGPIAAKQGAQATNALLGRLPWWLGQGLEWREAGGVFNRKFGPNGHGAVVVMAFF